RCQEILKYFLHRYQDRRASSVFATFLACFSESLDDETQWTRYGREGAGACLQVEVIKDESFPKESEDPPIMARTTIRVRYKQELLRDSIRRSFRQILDGYDAFPNEMPETILHDVRTWAGAGLDRVAAYANTAAKRPFFRSEREWRLVAIARS